MKVITRIEWNENQTARKLFQFFPFFFSFRQIIWSLSFGALAWIVHFYYVVHLMDILFELIKNEKQI